MVLSSSGEWSGSIAAESHPAETRAAAGQFVTGAKAMSSDGSTGIGEQVGKKGYVCVQEGESGDLCSQEGETDKMGEAGGIDVQEGETRGVCVKVGECVNEQEGAGLQDSGVGEGRAVVEQEAGWSPHPPRLRSSNKPDPVIVKKS